VHIYVFERDMHSITEVQSLAKRTMYWGLKGCTIHIGWLCMLALPVQCYRIVKSRGRPCWSIMDITCMESAVCPSVGGVIFFRPGTQARIKDSLFVCWVDNRAPCAAALAFVGGAVLQRVGLTCP